MKETKSNVVAIVLLLAISSIVISAIQNEYHSWLLLVGLVTIVSTLFYSAKTHVPISMIRTISNIKSGAEIVLRSDELHLGSSTKKYLGGYIVQVQVINESTIDPENPRIYFLWTPASFIVEGHREYIKSRSGSLLPSSNKH